MAYRHGKDTVILLAGNDISQYTNTTSREDETQVHKTTGYGAARESYQSGLGDGTFTIGGVYNDAVGGPARIIKPLKVAGAAVTFIYRPEGTGSGKAQDSVQVLIKTFNISSPVGDNVAWTAELQMSGDLDITNQP
jgi:hypothetical protein